MAVGEKARLGRCWHEVLADRVEHDEIVAEVKKDFGSAEEFKEVIMEPIAKLDWARGWPVSVDAWEGDRYKK